jgi:hypothetical protein
MQGVIQSIEYSKKGAPKFKINGAWYYAGRCKVDTLHVGAEIEFESNLFGEQNNLNGLQWWKPTQGGKPSGNTSNAPQNRPNGASAPAAVPSTDALILPFISNTIAHAIQAGLIKSPEDLTGWVMGARAALSARTIAKPERQPQTMADPEFNDDLDAAFYGHGNRTDQPEF